MGTKVYNSLPPEIKDLFHNIKKFGSGSVVGIATAYGLDGPGIESRGGDIFRTRPDRL